MLVKEISEVIDELSTIIAWAYAENSALGYFPVLYRTVTIKVKEAIQKGEFDDNERMNRFDVLFANRYLNAFKTWRSGNKPTKSWELTFQASQQSNYLALQHLLLGMNAHINLDLAIVAARICPGEKISLLEGDFMKINALLASLIDEVEGSVGLVSPILHWLDRVGGKADEKIVDFSLKAARKASWKEAQNLAFLDELEQEERIRQLDQEVAGLIPLIEGKRLYLKYMMKLIKIPESRNPRLIMKALNELT